MIGRPNPLTGRALVKLLVGSMVSGPPAVIKTGPVILNHDVDLAAIDPRPTWADSESIAADGAQIRRSLWEPVHYVPGLGDMASLWE